MKHNNQIISAADQSNPDPWDQLLDLVLLTEVGMKIAAHLYLEGRVTRVAGRPLDVMDIQQALSFMRGKEKTHPVQKIFKQSPIINALFGAERDLGLSQLLSNQRVNNLLPGGQYISDRVHSCYDAWIGFFINNSPALQNINRNDRLGAYAVALREHIREMEQTETEQVLHLPVHGSWYKNFIERNGIPEQSEIFSILAVAAATKFFDQSPGNFVSPPPKLLSFLENFKDLSTADGDLPFLINTDLSNFIYNSHLIFSEAHDYNHLNANGQAQALVAFVLGVLYIPEDNCYLDLDDLANVLKIKYHMMDEASTRKVKFSLRNVGDFHLGLGKVAWNNIENAHAHMALIAFKNQKNAQNAINAVLKHDMTVWDNTCIQGYVGTAVARRRFNECLSYNYDLDFADLDANGIPVYRPQGDTFPEKLFSTYLMVAKSDQLPDPQKSQIYQVYPVSHEWRLNFAKRIENGDIIAIRKGPGNEPIYILNRDYTVSTLYDHPIACFWGFSGAPRANPLELFQAPPWQKLLEPCRPQSAVLSRDQINNLMDVTNPYYFTEYPAIPDLSAEDAIRQKRISAEQPKLLGILTDAAQDARYLVSAQNDLMLDAARDLFFRMQGLLSLNRPDVELGNHFLDQHLVPVHHVLTSFLQPLGVEAWEGFQDASFSGDPWQDLRDAAEQFRIAIKNITDPIKQEILKNTILNAIQNLQQTLDGFALKFGDQNRQSLELNQLLIVAERMTNGETPNDPTTPQNPEVMVRLLNDARDAVQDAMDGARIDGVPIDYVTSTLTHGNSQPTTSALPDHILEQCLDKLELIHRSVLSLKRSQEGPAGVVVVPADLLQTHDASQRVRYAQTDAPDVVHQHLAYARNIFDRLNISIEAICSFVEGMCGRETMPRSRVETCMDTRNNVSLDEAQLLVGIANELVDRRLVITIGRSNIRTIVPTPNIWNGLPGEVSVDVLRRDGPTIQMHSKCPEVSLVIGANGRAKYLCLGEHAPLSNVLALFHDLGITSPQPTTEIISRTLPAQLGPSP